MTMRVAAYCRVSTDKEEQLSSLESQRTYFSRYIAQAADWELAEIYYDEGVSGTETRRREGFQRMMADAYAGRIDLIVTKEVSRFARNTVDLLSCTRKLASMGIGIVFINDNIHTLASDGELRLSIMASIAQEESRKTSERVKWGQKRRMETGIVFGRSMLGYDVRDGRLSVESQGAKIVRLIFHKYVHENKGTHVIARELQEAGMHPMRGSAWSSTVILRVLRNEKYVGDLCQKKTYTPDYLTHIRRNNNGAEEKIYLKNHHEPIIDRHLWERAQAILAERTRALSCHMAHGNRYWCSGKVICGACGAHFVSRTKKRPQAVPYHAWRCAEAAKHGARHVPENTQGCSMHSVNEKVLLSAVAFVLRHICMDKATLLEQMKEKLLDALQTPVKQDFRELDKKIAQVTIRKQTLLERFLDGFIQPEDYRRQNAMYDRQMTELQCRMEAEHRMHADAGDAEERLHKCLTHVRNLLAFEHGDPAVCGAVTERVTVCGNQTLEVKLWHVPPVRLRYRTSGRGDGYKVTLHMENSLLP